MVLNCPLWLTYFGIWMMLFGCLNADFADPSLHIEVLPTIPEREKLGVDLTIDIPFSAKILVHCKNNNPLTFYEVPQKYFESFIECHDVEIEFVECFNNDTDNANYNYNLMGLMNDVFNFQPNKTWDSLKVVFEQYAIVNSDEMFKNFDFTKFNDVTFDKVGFESTKFFNFLNCSGFSFEMNKQIDFNDFNDESLAKDFETDYNKLINFNKSNLKKFNLLTNFKITFFDLEDYNVFNTADLFEFNPNLKNINIQNSLEKVTFHEHVFRGLRLLTSLAVQDLQLDYIPKDLFKDLTSLESLFMCCNNIKQLDPTTFENNPSLSYISITSNPFYTEPQEETDYLKLGDLITELWLGNFTQYTFKLIEQLGKNKKLDTIIFNEMLIDRLDLNEFTKLQMNRETPLTVKFFTGDVILDLDIVSVGFNLTTEPEVELDKLNMKVELPIGDNSFCFNCALFKQIFPLYLNNHPVTPLFYFEASRVLVNPRIDILCQNLEIHFEENYIDNCPPSCSCKYSPLLDKIKIDCSNKNLTQIPIIPYPVQFSPIHSIELNFENNLLTVLSLSNQDNQVIEKLSTLLFNNNTISSIEIKGEYAKYIRVLDLCDNPILADGKNVTIEGIETLYEGFSTIDCRSGSTYPYYFRSYIQDEKTEDVGRLLSGLKCN